jgi:hypothetical protein
MHAVAGMLAQSLGQQYQIQVLSWCTYLQIEVRLAASFCCQGGQLSREQGGKKYIT